MSVEVREGMSSSGRSAGARVAIGGILHETHSFMTGGTALADFAAQSLHVGEDMLSSMRASRSGIGGMIERASEYGWTLLPTLYAAAMPAGIVTEAAYRRLLGELMNRLAQHRPVDGVLLALHGAMVAEGELDAETDIVAQARAIVGDATPIVVLLDMHGNISPRLVELADVLLAYNTNPHIDAYARGLEAAETLARLLRREIQPTAAYARPALLLPAQSTGTDAAPLAPVHARAADIKAEDEVVAIAVMAGFAYADTPYSGPSIIVTTDAQPALAASYAEELSAILYARRSEALPRFLSPEEAVSKAKQLERGPVILVDSADNIGGGTAGDGAEALAAMLAQDVRDGAIVLADPEAVAICWDAGEAAEVRLAVGGKVDDWHGRPVTVTGTVRALSDGEFDCELPDNHFASFYGDRVQMGRSAWLRAAGVNILLTERKTPPLDLAQLRHIGIMPERQRMIVVKSAVAWRAAYQPIAAAVIEMDTAGLCSANLSRFPYRHLKRPVFPLD
ncbi:MAG: M81 family metallopeptidase [Chloroflexota bacterium]|nr:M81 family metallopeptidase [Chloroflexota bacterium]MDE2946720.1 M81 family metallopeptidase [Chloroflexota bacterium]